MSKHSENKHHNSEHQLTSYFSEAEIALREEVRHHHDLMLVIAMSGAEDFNEALAHIAAYCSIAVDGVYSKEDLDALCGELKSILYKMRTGITIPGTLKRIN